MELRFILSLAFAIFVAIFAIQNSGIVTINFLFDGFEVSQALVILISAALGAIIALLLGAVKQFKLQRKIKEHGRTIEQLEKDLNKCKENNETTLSKETLENGPLKESDLNITRNETKE